jgi:hypothetical protein
MGEIALVASACRRKNAPRPPDFLLDGGSRKARREESVS